MVAVKVSKEFKKQAYRSILSIVLFALVYLLLFVLSIAVFVGCCYGGIMLIALKPSFFTIMIGVGLAIVGVFILYFMIKFIFKNNKTDYSNFIEIDIDSEPNLKLLLEELVNEIDTEFPKKIFISHEVNASVFYDSNFWSMFFPIKKNLHIGLGLVNSLTVEELKGILAHEFGHFSQKSMKLGSYVYNVNHVIYNMLYDNDEYDKAIHDFGSKSGYFAILMWMPMLFNKGVQFVLKLVYKIVNVNYMGLSREMEFHADAIAAHVVGSKPMISSMLRMDIASQSFDTTLNFYSEKIKDAVKTDNIFPQHIIAMNFLAEKNNIPLQDNLPQISIALSERFNKSKLNIDNQWASHPSNDERIASFLKLDIETPENNSVLANALFTNISKTQALVSENLFAKVDYPEHPKIEDKDVFAIAIKQKFEENKFPSVFNTYYDNYNTQPFEIETIDTSNLPVFETLFHDDKIELIAEYNALTNDSNTLKSISENNFDLKSFDYDGIKYKAEQALEVHEKLALEIEKKSLQIKTNDEAIFSYCYQMAVLKQNQQTLIDFYHDSFDMEKVYEDKMKHYFDLADNFTFAYQTLKYDVIKNKLKTFENYEITFKNALSELLSDESFQEIITPEIRKECLDYIDSNANYFYNDTYNSDAIQSKDIAMNHYFFLLQEGYYLKKKKLLNFKASLV